MFLSIAYFQQQKFVKKLALLCQEEPYSLVYTSSALVLLLFFSFFFSPHFYFPASGQQAVVTGVVPSSPRFLPSFFCRAWGSAIPLLVDFSSGVANSRSRAFRKSICAQEKVPTKYTRMHSAGLELTKLTYNTRLDDNLIRHRGDRY